MESVIKDLQDQLTIRSSNYVTWESKIKSGQAHLPIESLEKLETEIGEYAQAIAILTKHLKK